MRKAAKLKFTHAAWMMPERVRAHYAAEANIVKVAPDGLTIIARRRAIRQRGAPCPDRF